jgi:hypothetical protein
MRHGFVRMAWAIAFVLLFLINGALAQGYHQLTAADFKGSPHPRIPGNIAYTNCTIHFTYQVNKQNRNDYLLTANVQLIMNHDRSWLDSKNIGSEKMLNEILNHEQGHYMIAYMQQQEILRQINRTRFGANYQAQAQALFDRIDAKYKQLNDNYETDTRNMQDRVQQHSWDMYFKKRLEYMPPVDPDDNYRSATSPKIIKEIPYADLDRMLSGKP